MPSCRSRVALVVASLLLVLAPPTARAQDAGMLRALDLEQAGRMREAAAAFREAMRTPNFFPALLGLERAYAELGQSDSLLPVLDSLVRARPRDAGVRTVLLRTLHGLGRDVALRQAFERWAADVPRDASPYREYARQLLQDGRSASADSVLQRAATALGSPGALAPEMAQLRAQMGLWAPSAREWRIAIVESPYLVQSASFSLAGAPSSARDSIRAVLREPPDRLPVRRLRAALELAWGAPSEAWTAIADLVPSDSAAQAWMEFGEQAEGDQQWLVARNAFAAAAGWKPGAPLFARAADLSLRGGDAALAEALAARAMAGPDSVTSAQRALPIRVRALALLGRPGEAAVLAEQYARFLDDGTRASIARAAAWGWVRRGDIARAREALRQAGGADADDTAERWLALYEGDLDTARAEMRHASESSPELVAAMALLARTRASRGPATGAAFLALARGDSLSAAEALAAASRELPEAAPLLLAMSARVYAAQQQPARAIALWQTIVSEHAAAPEAPEADLEWARTLQRTGRHAEAVLRLEHLILTYPGSALVPQARRELELLRGGLPKP